MTRPQIPSALDEQITDILDDAGYTSVGEFVRDASRRRIEELQEGHIEDITPDFKQRTYDGPKNAPTIGDHAFQPHTVRVDPFQLSVPSMFTYGPIGSGKQVTTDLFLHRLLQSRDDVRVMTVNSGIGTHENLIRHYDGKQTVIGPHTQVNPMDPIPAAGHKNQPETEGVFDLTIETVLIFVKTVLWQEGEELGQAEQLARDAIKDAYRHRGIDEDTEITGEESPVVEDVVDSLVDMMKHPRSHSSSRSEVEARTRQQYASDLVRVLSSWLEANSERYNGRTETDLTDSRVQSIEVQNVQTETHLQTSIRHVFREAAQVDDDVLIVLEDNLNITQSQSVTELLQLLVRHGRHLDVGFNIVTQDKPREWADLIVDNCGIQLVHKASRTSDVDRIAFNKPELEFITNASTGEEGYVEVMLNIIDTGAVPVRVQVQEGVEEELVE